MKLLVSIVVGSWFALSSCSTEPEPLLYGTESCYSCKMTLVDNKFGAELVTKKGKIYKFDDMRCLLSFYNSTGEPKDLYQHIMVIDYANPGTLVNGRKAFYASSPVIRSPMDGQIAAFGSKETMDNFKNKWKGIYLTWEEVTTRHK